MVAEITEEIYLANKLNYTGTVLDGEGTSNSVPKSYNHHY
jgi:hypothetical protein